ncbi:hypothetical protein NRI_0102 [Neorickettsia risticii str. Illinois]|uniref:Uncharacterized protein n=1 Tax=Neorickettsia risticii (strain Illinois) TaxID=434131 RepID=C6V3Y3_NEORI|nr:hypothetical protein NRI_0102 [Neorickettsia risticii str. Illinois]
MCLVHVVMFLVLYTLVLPNDLLSGGGSLTVHISVSTNCCSAIVFRLQVSLHFSCV